MKTFWQGKRILITGASSGLGWALAEALAPFNTHLGLLARREEKLKELANKVQSLGSTPWWQPCDVRKRTDVYMAVEAFYQAAGGLDVVWVNAGVAGETAFHNWDWQVVEDIIDINLKGAIYTTRAVLEKMVPKGRGTVVAIGSVASLRGLPRHGLYSLSKIGLHYFIESLAVELPMIRFTIIHPGYVDTPINRHNPDRNRPFLLTPEDAAQRMLRAVARGKKIYIYPTQMRLLYRLVRSLPYFMYLWFTRKLIPPYDPMRAARNPEIKLDKEN